MLVKIDKQKLRNKTIQKLSNTKKSELLGRRTRVRDRKTSFEAPVPLNMSALPTHVATSTTDG